MSKVIVTGASGFVGYHLAHELSTSGARVIGIAQDQNSTLENVSYQQIDLSDRNEVRSKLDYSGIDGVIHLAGMAAVGGSFDEPLKYINVNSAIQINLMEAALEQNSHAKFVVVSSGSVYGPNNPLPLTEKSATLPTSPYSVSKLAQENLAQYYAYRGLHCIIARPFNHIGPGQKAGFIVPDLACQVEEAKKSGQSEIRVGNLSTERDYTDVRDIVRAYRLLLDTGQSGEIYNICSGVAHSGTEILNTLADIAGVKIYPVKDDSKNRPIDNPLVYGDFTKLSEVTGWKPEIKLEQTLTDFMRAL